MKQLEAIIPVYIKNNIPFALFRYPGQAIKIVAQYGYSPMREKISELRKGFLIHPFKPSVDCPIACILPDIYTSDFDEINIDRIPNLQNRQIKVYSETCIDQSTYLTHIKKYKKIFQQGNLTKAVYSRIKDFSSIPISNLVYTFLNMEAAHTDAFCYLFHLPYHGTWLGASPEQFLSYQNGIAKTVALAGTQSAEQKNTAWGDKEKEEQAYVSQFIVDRLKQFNLKLLNESKTDTINAGSVQHLKTDFEFSLSDNMVIPFLNTLHPTPAVAGCPQTNAIDLILETEIHDRQYYTGYLGFINGSDALDLYVNLRCAKITAPRTLAFVGGGITEDSDPLAEWQETENKSKTIGDLTRFFLT